MKSLGVYTLVAATAPSAFAVAQIVVPSCTITSTLTIVPPCVPRICDTCTPAPLNVKRSPQVPTLVDPSDCSTVTTATYLPCPTTCLTPVCPSTLSTTTTAPACSTVTIGVALPCPLIQCNGIICPASIATVELQGRDEQGANRGGPHGHGPPNEVGNHGIPQGRPHFTFPPEEGDCDGPITANLPPIPTGFPPVPTLPPVHTFEPILTFPPAGCEGPVTVTRPTTCPTACVPLCPVV